MKGLKTYADQVNAWASRRVLSGKPLPNKDSLRDMADQVSQGDLDTMQLDIVCDMIDRKIATWLKRDTPILR
jgi:hypothetical protein